MRSRIHTDTANKRLRISTTWSVWFGFVVVAVIGIITRIVFTHLQLQADSLYSWPVVDEVNYVLQAEQLVRSSWDFQSMKLPFWQPPGCVFIMAICLASGLKISGIILVQQFVGVVNALLVHGLSRRVMPRASRVAAMLPGILFSLCPAILYYETKLHKPVWIIFFMLMMFCFARRHGRPRFAVTAGLSLGLLILTESYFVLLVPLVYATVYMKETRRGLLFIMFTLVPVLPVAAINTMHAGRPVFMSYNGGINFYIGNNEHWVQTYNIPPGWPWKKYAHQYSVEGHAAENKFTSDVLDYFMENPAKFLAGFAEKGFLLFSARELPRDNMIAYSERLIPLSWIFNIMLAALAGAAAASRSKKTRWLIIAAGLVAFINIVFFPSTRYRLPAIPLLLLCIPALEMRRRVIVCALLAAGLSAYAGAKAGHYADYSMWQAVYFREAGQRYVLMGELEKARESLELAVNADASVESLMSLGHFAFQFERNYDRARSLFEQAVFKDADYPDAHYYLGGLYFQDGDYIRATENFDRYLELRAKWRYPQEVDSFMLLRSLACIKQIEAGCGTHENALRKNAEIQTIMKTVSLRPSTPADQDLLNQLTKQGDI